MQIYDQYPDFSSDGETMLDHVRPLHETGQTPPGDGIVMSCRAVWNSFAAHCLGILGVLVKTMGFPGGLWVEMSKKEDLVYIYIYTKL